MEYYIEEVGKGGLVLIGRLTVVAAVVALLGGCASQIMQGYVGKPLSAVVVEHGPPVYSFDTEPGSRTFIWSKTNSGVIPGSSVTNANVMMIGNSAQLYGTTTYNPPIAYSHQCTYAINARKARDDIEGPAAWVVTGFEPPNLMCE